ncbi:MAG: cysteine methyltransferase [Magnetovibrio sp.]|nr:cysteine methyltransferase [Magnetovibrio sp.]
MNYLTIDSPVGVLTLFANKECLISVQFKANKNNTSSPILEKTQLQLQEYFMGKRKIFSIPLGPKGTKFQATVWRLLLKIPIGKTKTYGELAKECGSFPRAIGHACKFNPIPIIIPCHRVIKKNKDLGGYSGGNGKKTKRDLLLMEGYKALENF